MSCNSCSNITLPQGAQGPQGAAGTNGTDGADGTDGLFGGYSLEWIFDTSTSPSPPATKVRFNNATPASVTKIYINETASGSIDAANFLQSFTANNDPGNYGLIKIWKQYDSTIFWLGKVSAITDNGSDRTIDVSHTLSNGTFSASDDVIVSFVSNGASGSNKSGVLDNYSILDDGANYEGTTPTLVRTFTIPANTFETNKDEVTIKGGFSGDLDQESTNGIYYFKVEVGGVDVVSILSNSTMTSAFAIPGKQFEMKLYRISATELRPVILYEQLYLRQMPSAIFASPNDDISTSDPLVLNLYPNVEINGGYANRSFEAITPSSFASSMDVKIYMWSSTQGSRLDPYKFRLMNLHAAFNKV